MRLSSYARIAAIGTFAGRTNAAITLDLTSTDSIKSAASTVAYDMMTYYTGNRTGDTPGNLPDPYYWWECGAMFGTMVNYWYYTGDTSYNEATSQALLHQAGDDGDYMPLNQTKTLGNDDQGFWGMAAMTAAEVKFPDPPKSSPSWLSLAQGVFNTQVVRYDTEDCGGGFRWQIFPFNAGYDYKNSISNGCFFNIAARLALYTGNQTYADWAVRTFDWILSVDLMGPDYKVYDGARVAGNCSTHDQTRWTYNTGIFLMGSAVMYNYTNGSDIWRERVEGLLAASNDFYTNDVMFEACEGGKCNVDQRSFKAYFARELAATAELAPFTHDAIMAKLATTAAAAIKTCTAGDTGTQCGLRWTTGANDGSLGVGEQMSVLEVLQSNLVDGAPGWVSNVRGTGSSVGDVNAGGEGKSSPQAIRPVTTLDKAGAGILTALIIIGVIIGSTVMCL